MTGSRLRPAFLVGLFLGLLAVTLPGVQSEEELEPVPPEDLCRPYIEKALKDLGTGSLEQTSAEVGARVDEESREEEAGTASAEADEQADEQADEASREDEQSTEGEEERQESVEEEEAVVGSAEATEEKEDASEEAKASAEAGDGGEAAGEESAEAAGEESAEVPAEESAEKAPEKEESAEVTPERESFGSKLKSTILKFINVNTLVPQRAPPRKEEEEQKKSEEVASKEEEREEPAEKGEDTEAASKEDEKSEEAGDTDGKSEEEAKGDDRSEEEEAKTEEDQKSEEEEEVKADEEKSEEGTKEEMSAEEEGEDGTKEEKSEEEEGVEGTKEEKSEEEDEGAKEEKSEEEEEGGEEEKSEEDVDQTAEEKSDEDTVTEDGKSDEEAAAADEGKSDEEKDETAEDEGDDSKAEDDGEASEEAEEEVKADTEEESKEEGAAEAEESKEEEGAASVEEEQDSTKEEEEGDSKGEEEGESKEATAEEVSAEEEKEGESKEEAQVESEEGKEEEEGTKESEETKEEDGEDEGGKESEEGKDEEGKESEEKEETGESAQSAEEQKSGEEEKEEEKGEVKSRGRREVGEEPTEEDGESKEEGEEKTGSEEEGESGEPTPEEELIQEIEIPENLRPRNHINQLLKLDEENEEKEKAIQKVADIVLRDLKKLYENAIKPLETLYKYRDLSNRHFGDPEIFSKPLVLFMGPWSGGKSSIINYLLDIEYKQTSLRTGAEPSPAYFNILMYGEEEEVLDGTQLAADWTFSGLQKFGQGMLDRLRGRRLDNKLLEKVNIVEIPGILEIRKQVQRLFPFNDACQWFIDRADIIFLVYDPSKLDVGPETEAILDQLKGRESQTRIILNKADQVKPEELMRVQGALIWNISPLMSSAEPPIMYSTSLWSLPYEAGAPTRLLYAQERAFLRDLRSAIDKRVEHKIASARRFAVRVRNHAKMVDCYLTTYYNQKTFFGNKKEISDKIIENPQDYHIYEGLSTLTNISRYDLPDPDVYRDFFRLNVLYDFQLLSSTCTYFRGCPINRLDVAIAYDLPELVGKYRKSVEAVLHEHETNTPTS